MSKLAKGAARQTADQFRPDMQLFRYMVDHIVKPSDYLYRTIYHFQGCYGTEYVLPAYEIFMLCQKLLFASMDAVGISTLVRAALDNDDGQVQEFYQFNNYILNMKVISVLDEVIGDRLEEISGDLADELTAKRVSILLTTRETDDKALSKDFILWTAFKTVMSILIQTYRHNYQLDYPSSFRDWMFLSDFLAEASAKDLPKSTGRPAKPELDAAAALVLYVFQTTNHVRVHICEPSNDPDVKAKCQYMEEYFFFRFYMDPSVERDSSERDGMRERVRELITEGDLLSCPLYDDKSRCTKLATGLDGDQVSELNDLNCMWLSVFLDHDPCSDGILEYPSADKYGRIKKLSSKNPAHKSPMTIIAKADFKKILSDIGRYHRGVPGQKVVQVQRLLEALVYLCNGLKFGEKSSFRNEIVETMKLVMKESHAQRDWHTFGMAMMPLILFNMKVQITPDEAQRSGFLQSLLDSFDSDNQFVLWCTSISLTLFYLEDKWASKIAELGFLDKLMHVIKNPNTSDHVILQASLSIPSALLPAATPCIPKALSFGYIVAFLQVITDSLIRKRNFETVRFQVHPHEMSLQSVLRYGEILIPALRKSYLMRNQENCRKWVVMGLLSVTNFLYNSSVEAHQFFCKIGGPRVLHMTLREKDKDFLAMALQTCAKLCRTALPYCRQALAKLPGFIGDVARIFVKYTKLNTEEPALDIMCSLCQPVIDDRTVWAEWLDSQHTNDKLMERLMRVAGNLRPLSTTTFAMGVVANMARHGNDNLIFHICCSDIVAICKNHITKVTKSFGQPKTQEIVNYSVQTLSCIAKRNPRILDGIHAHGLIKPILLYCGSQYPMDNNIPFEPVIPVWIGIYAEAEMQTEDSNRMDKEQRGEIMKTSLELLETLASYKIKPESFFCSSLLEAEYLFCYQRVMMKVNENLGQTMIDPVPLQRLDTHEQWGWYEVMHHSRIVRHILRTDVGPLFVSKFFKIPELSLQCLHNLLLVSIMSERPLESTRDLCDTMTLILASIMPSHFEENTAARRTTPLTMLFKCRQTLYRNQWKGDLLLDTMFTYVDFFKSTLAYDAFARFVCLINYCISRDPELALEVESTDAYRRCQILGGDITLISNRILRTQLSYCRKRKGASPYSNPTLDRFDDKKYSDAPIHMRMLLSVTADRQMVLPMSTDSMTIPPPVVGCQPCTIDCDKALRNRIEQLAGQTVLGRLPPTDALRLTRASLDGKSPFENPEMKKLLDAEITWQTNHQASASQSIPPYPKDLDWDSTEMVMSYRYTLYRQNRRLLDQGRTIGSSKSKGQRTLEQVTPPVFASVPEPTADAAQKKKKKKKKKKKVQAGKEVPTTSTTSTDEDHVESDNGQDGKDTCGAEKAAEDTAAAKQNRTCDQCGVLVHKPKLCARCRKARYCSRECQRLNWKTHRDVCVQQEQAE